MKSSITFFFFFGIAVLLVVGGWGVHALLWDYPKEEKDLVMLRIETGESLATIIDRLDYENIIEHPTVFGLYMNLRGFDRQIKAGNFKIEPPFTTARVARALMQSPSREEKTITILPGWDLRDIAKYLEQEGIGTEQEFHRITGLPATDMRTLSSIWNLPIFDYPMLQDKPDYISLEGYLSPDTFRVFADATQEDVVKKLLAHRQSQVQELSNEIENSEYDMHEIMTLASLVEREVRSPEDRAMVADLFMRRLKQGWALQADSTVHYVVGKKGNVFTTKQDRDTGNPWNTYKYPGLPPGPIASPSLSSIKAVLSPKKNTYWYFLTDMEGNVHYGRTLDEHNANVQKYLR